MDAPRRDMELLSNSLAAYAHIRGEGRPRDLDPSLPPQAPLHPFPPLLHAPATVTTLSQSLTPKPPPTPPTSRWRLPKVPQIEGTVLAPQTQNLESFRDGMTPTRQAPSVTSAL